MKLYFYMLTVLTLSKLFRAYLLIQEASRFISPTYGSYRNMIMVKNFADIILFTACLGACYLMAFGKKALEPKTWRLVMNGTLTLGAFSVMLYGFPELFNGPPAYGSSFIWLAGDFLTYVLFVIPVILYERSLRGEK